MATNKVTSLERYREEYKAEAENCSVTEVFPGFSERLNLLMDHTEDLNIPAMDERGRIAYIHKITGHSKPAVSDWLKKDILPRDQTLRGLITFLLRHIPGDYNVLRVESWVRFGDEATPCPLSLNKGESDTVSLRPLAAKLIADAGKDLTLTVSSYDLQNTMEDVTQMLADYGVRSFEDIQQPLRDLAKYYIQQHLRDE
jgi:hypothetical protein